MSEKPELRGTDSQVSSLRSQVSRRIGILVVSDRASRGEYPDLSGPAIARWADRVGFAISASKIVPDTQGLVEAQLREWADGSKLDLILTSGGTGLGPRDVTPEATLKVIEREIRGIPELVRGATSCRTPTAFLSRAVAGLRGRSLIVNLPGNPKGVEEWLEVLEPLLDHAFAMVAGASHACI